jgi:hypothetical protein
MQGVVKEYERKESRRYGKFVRVFAEFSLGLAYRSARKVNLYL